MGILSKIPVPIQFVILIVLIISLFKRSSSDEYILPDNIEPMIIQHILIQSVDSTLTYEQVAKLIDSSNAIYVRRKQQLEKSYIQHLYKCVVRNNKLIRADVDE